MSETVYGVWDGVVHDFRQRSSGERVQLLSGLEEFAPHNATKAFIADRGFIVFDRDTSLVEAFSQYMAQAARESCGRCAPCRVGTQRMRDLLREVSGGSTRAALLDEIAETATQVSQTSLCGLGQSCARALVDALRYFRDEFKPLTPAQAIFQHSFVYTTAPCIEACPSKVDVPRYIDGIKGGKFDFALGVVLDKYPLVATCGRVCVRFCETACRRSAVDGAVGIRALKRYAADQAVVDKRLRWQKSPFQHGKRVAVIGAGPAGITCAYKLLLNGVKVDIFDAQKAAGGMASIGIPSYRLPKNVLKAESEDVIRQLGGEFFYGKRFGDDFKLAELFANGYDAVFLAYGASQGTRLGIGNEQANLAGYASGLDFLLKVHQHVESGEYGEPHAPLGDVIVVGAGNVAMDCVRSARRMGARSVHLIYRRTREDMPAAPDEVAAAEQEGIVFHCLTNPTALRVDNGQVVGVDLVRMRQTDRDRKGRHNVAPIPGSEFMMPGDLVIAAIGQQVAADVFKAEDGVEVDRWNCIVVDLDTLASTRQGVFAGGDCVLGPLTLVHALEHGERGAASIFEYLLNGEVTIKPERRMQQLIARNKLCTGADMVCHPLQHTPVSVHETDAAERITNFDEVDQVLSKEQAYEEAGRCLRCYRMYSVVSEKQLPHESVRAGHREPIFPE